MVAGRFALCDPLARGATGTVWRAWDLQLGDWCAAKLMRQRDAGDVLRFAREQGVRLTHPRLVTPYSWAAEDAHVVVASRLVAGGSLHTLLGDHGPLAADLVLDLLDQLLDGLAHVHAAGIVHRDVTPANVLLEATGAGRPELRLADFGLAVRTGEPRLTRLGTVLGTVGYVPPEVLAGAAPHPAADLYAAGRLALALLTGTEPDPDQPTGLTSAPASGDPTGAGTTGAGRAGAGPVPLAAVPDVLRELLVALTAADPADRPASADAARRVLGEVPPAHRPRTADGEPVEVLVQLPDLPSGWTPAGPPGSPPAGDAADGEPAGPDPRTGPIDPEAVSRSTARLHALLATSPLPLPPRPAGPDPAGPDPAGPADASPALPATAATAATAASVPATLAGPSPAGPAAASPVGADPVGAGPVGTRPVGAGPVGASPVGARPVGGRPVAPVVGATGAFGSAPPAEKRPGSRRWWAGIAAAVVLVAVVVSVVLTQWGGGGGAPGTTPSPSPSGVPVVSGPAAAGGTCGWQQEGDAARAGDGRALRCVRTAEGYRWQVS